VWNQIEQEVNRLELSAAFTRLVGPTAKGRAAALSEVTGLLTHAAGKVLGLVNPVAGMVLDLAAGLHPEPSVAEQVSRALGERSKRSGAEEELWFNRSARIHVLEDLRGRMYRLEGQLPSSLLSAEL
jgi:hypothetical protein